MSKKPQALGTKNSVLFLYDYLYGSIFRRYDNNSSYYRVSIELSRVCNRKAIPADPSVRKAHPYLDLRHDVDLGMNLKRIVEFKNKPYYEATLAPESLYDVFPTETYEKLTATNPSIVRDSCMDILIPCEQTMPYIGQSYRCDAEEQTKKFRSFILGFKKDILEEFGIEYKPLGTCLNSTGTNLTVGKTYPIVEIRGDLVSVKVGRSIKLYKTKRFNIK